MDRSPLRVSPVAALLVDLTERRDTGRMLLGDRSLVISAGELAHVGGAPQDYHFHEFLVRAGQLTREQCRELERRAQTEQTDFYRALLSSELLPAAEVRSQRRALWLGRLERALREHLDAPVTSDTWMAGTDAVDMEALDADLAATPNERARLLPLVLDALTRNTQSADAQRLESSTDLRWFWSLRSASNDAKQWASFGELPDGVTLSALFAKRPKSAPQLAALLRAGLGSLEPAVVRAHISMAPTIADAIAASLAPPPARLTRAPTAAWSQHPPAPLPPPSAAPVRAARLHLDPGGFGEHIDEIPVVALPTWPERSGPFHDPLREIEQKLDESTEPAHRAELFCVLADLWDQRIGSLEEAARNCREAAAALPTDARLLLRAARACFRVGHGVLAVRYVLAALPECRTKELRLEALSLLATLQERSGDAAAVNTLRRAAAEDASLAWPHERSAQLYYGRSMLPLAAAQLRAAGQAERERAPQRALANYAQAYESQPHDEALAYDYADALTALGQPETAVAVLACAAHGANSEARRRMLRDAAERAGQCGLTDLAVEHGLTLWAEQAGDRAALGPLLAMLARRGMEAERAAILEVHAATTSEEREQWQARALEALARVAPQAAPSAFERDSGGDRAALRAEVQASRDADERRRALTRLAAHCARANDPRAVIETCLELLALAPGDPLARARLWCACAAAAPRDLDANQKALEWLERATTGRERARALAQLAQRLERRDDLDGALAHAHAALDADPSAADAALLALRHIARCPAERAQALLQRVQRVLGNAPAVLLAAAGVHARAGALDAQRRALAELIRRGPNLTQPRILWLRSWLGSSDIVAIERAAHELLTHVHASHAGVDAELKAAIERLAHLGALAAAAQLADRLLANLGQLDAPYAERAYALAAQSGKSTLVLRALERLASAHSGTARADHLLQIADRHAAAADRAAELRALLRAAAIPEGRARALETLTARYAELGDVQRLLTVMALRLDATTDVVARRTLLFAMASAVMTFTDDRIRAGNVVLEALRECAGERQGLLQGLGALFALGSSDWAFQTARELSAQLDPSSAGACYLWLAHRAETQAGAASLALELALEGARRFPVEGELLLLAERLTLAQADKAGILGLYAASIDQASGKHGLRALHYRAGRWLERFGAYEEALDHFQRAFELAPHAGAISAALQRCRAAMAAAAETSEPSSPQPSAAATAPEITSEEDALHARIRLGELGALEELVERLRAHPERDEETLAMLARLVRAAPERTKLLRELQQRSLHAGATAQARVCDQIASLFDMRYPAHPRLVFAPAELAPEDLWQVAQADRPRALSRLLTLLWQHVSRLPQVLHPLEPDALGQAWDGGAEGTSAPLANAYERVLAALDRKAAPIYLRPNVALDVNATPTPELVLLVRSGLTDEPALEFQLGRALARAEPEHALVTALPDRTAQRVLHTALASFAPGAGPADLPRADAKLGAALRASMTGDVQAELAQLVAAQRHALDYARLMRDAEHAGVRAGLLVSGDIRTALECLARTEPALRGISIQNEQGFSRACAASSAFAEAVRTALSLPFVGCTELALEAAAEAF